MASDESLPCHATFREVLSHRGRAADKFHSSIGRARDRSFLLNFSYKSMPVGMPFGALYIDSREFVRSEYGESVEGTDGRDAEGQATGYRYIAIGFARPGKRFQA